MKKLSDKISKSGEKTLKDIAAACESMSEYSRDMLLAIGYGISIASKKKNLKKSGGEQDGIAENASTGSSI